MNIQLAMAIATILSLVLGSLAFIFVIWPSIRNAERRGARLEALLSSDDAKILFDAAKTKLLGFHSDGPATSREGFLREAAPGREEEGTVKL